LSKVLERPSVNTGSTLSIKTFRIALLILALAPLNCARRGEQPRMISASFHPGRIEVQLNSPVEGKNIIVEDVRGRALLRQPLPDVEDDSWSIAFPWQAGRTYRFILGITGGEISGEFTAPARDPVRFRLEVPSGFVSAGAESSPMLLPSESRVEIGLSFANDSGDAFTCELRLSFPAGVKVLDSGRWQIRETNEEVTLLRSFQIERFENRFEKVDIRVPSRLAPGASVKARANFSGPAGRFGIAREVPIFVAPAERIAEKLRLIAVEMPTDYSGNYDPTRMEDTISLSSIPGKFFRRLLGLATYSEDLTVPYAYQSVVVENLSEKAIPLVVRADIRQMKKDLPARGFGPPERYSVGGRLNVAAMVVRPKSRGKVVLPIYIYPKELAPGSYRRVITGRVFATDLEVFRTQKRLFVLRENRLAELLTFFAVMATLTSMGLFIFAQRRLFGSFQVRNLVLIALFGSTAFVVASLPATLLFNLIRLLTGPFSFLVAGFFSIVVFYALLGALLVLIPRPGTVFLATVVQFLMTSLFFGEFSPVGFLFTGTMIFLVEVALFAVGATSARHLLEGFRHHPLLVSLLVAGAVAAANAASLYVNFHLAIILYRLYYAGWYIILTAAVTGFGYTFIGVWAGLRLGESLKKFEV